MYFTIIKQKYGNHYTVFSLFHNTVPTRNSKILISASLMQILLVMNFDDSHSCSNKHYFLEQGTIVRRVVSCCRQSCPISKTKIFWSTSILSGAVVPVAPHRSPFTLINFIRNFAVFVRTLLTRRCHWQR